MAGVGGSIESIGIDGRPFSVAADVDSPRKLGGFENDVQPNGNNTGRIIKTAVSWMLGGINLNVDDFLEDHEFLQNIADSNSYHDITVTYASGAVYQGKGTITGELQWSSQNTVASCEFKGTGKLTKQ